MGAVVTNAPSMLASIAAIAGALLASACGSASTSVAPRDFADPSQVVDASGTFRAALSSRFEQATNADGIHEIQIPIDESVPIYCFIWPHEASLSVTALRSSQLIYQKMTETGFEISERRLVAIDSGVVGDTAYHSFKARFRLAFEGKSGVGLMKTAAANKQGHGIACNHWDAGYIQIFDQTFRELVQSFRARDPGPVPFYKEISQIRVGELTVGISIITFIRDEAGDVEGISESSTAVPQSASALEVTYSKTTEWTNAAGDLVNAYRIASDGEREHTDLALQWARELGWHVKGAHRGSAVESHLLHEGNIDSMLSHMLTLRYGLEPQGNRRRIVLMRWFPDANPANVAETSLSVDAEGDPGFALVEMAGQSLRLQRGADGIAETATVKFGGETMTIERIYREGDL